MHEDVGRERISQRRDPKRDAICRHYDARLLPRFFPVFDDDLSGEHPPALEACLLLKLRQCLLIIGGRSSATMLLLSAFTRGLRESYVDLELWRRTLSSAEMLALSEVNKSTEHREHGSGAPRAIMVVFNRLDLIHLHSKQLHNKRFEGCQRWAHGIWGTSQIGVRGAHSRDRPSYGRTARRPCRQRHRSIWRTCHRPHASACDCAPHAL